MGTATERDPLGDVALRLFAELGYDAVSPRLIADATGVQPDVLTARGGKSGLYLEILQRYFRAQNGMLDEIESTHTADAEGVYTSLTIFIEFELAHPRELAIWQHRGLGDAADLTDVEERFWNPIYQRISGILGPEVMWHPAYQLFVNLKTWAVYGFLFGGVITPTGDRLGPTDPEGRRLFRDHMYRLCDIVLDAGLRDAF
ncbi:TetR/AcrR family transcriptional regulator; helix-turn-helix transcriptional regulator [Actinocorallia sp. API 0066]|uniref:TetR/AcrR family transcriptional regulator n=1 Tax=Actinocorallia sp. API 0066 TaxID=2896846 RepID=UPI001E505F7F|nr:TetR/AcrR family transcriptional regulator [Actinocorallia sp. API 0066]MCD0451781.1 TetR/AcrR family transcriptional regulator; helix-turn-helix transcriptional regulator [Actinocorallia sp. API 0066]